MTLINFLFENKLFKIDVFEDEYTFIFRLFCLELFFFFGGAFFNLILFNTSLLFSS